MRSDMLMCSECGAPVTWEEAAKDRADTIREQSEHIHHLQSLLRDALPYVERARVVSDPNSGTDALAADIRQALGEDDE